jgi:hypothetical protein
VFSDLSCLLLLLPLAILGVTWGAENRKYVIVELDEFVVVSNEGEEYDDEGFGV